MFENWTKPQGCESATCLETRKLLDGTVTLRNSRAEGVPGGRSIWATPEEFAAFIAAAKAGFYDGLLP